VHINIIPSQYGSIPESVIFGEVGGDGPSPAAAGERGRRNGGAGPAASTSQPHSLWHSLSTAGGGHGDELGGLTTVSYSREGGTFKLAEFQAFMAHHFPETVIRAKGFLYFDCAPDSCYTLQLSGRRRFDASDRRRPRQQAQEAHRVDFVFIGTSLDRGEITRRLDACRSDFEAAGGEGSPLPLRDEGEEREAEAEALAQLIGKDMRFEVGARAADLPALVFFRLKPTRWHGMTTADMNRSLLSTFNARSDRSRLFLTHTTSHQGDADGFMLRFDMSAVAPSSSLSAEEEEAQRVTHSAREVWVSIQQATEAMLTNVFMNTFCCG